jgi:hypothetical protein
MIGLVALPALALAQGVDFCQDCTLGIYDDAQLSKNFGTTTPFVAKEIYVGINLGNGRTGVSTIEFSITGFNPANVLVTNTEGATPIAPNVLLGSVQAPADTTTGSGGMNAAWMECVVGSGPLLKLTLLPINATPNTILRVVRKFPTSNPNFLQSAVITACDNPNYTPSRVKGGCYVLAWDGTTNPTECPLFTGVASTTWGTVKTLYN